MKPWTRTFCLLSCTLTLASSIIPQILAETTEVTEKQEAANEIDQVVKIDPNTKFLQMSPEEKAEAYKKLDQIELTSQEIEPEPEYSQVRLIKSEKDYQALINQSKEKPVVIYLGFNECPYCRAFLPKFNHLAGEMNIDIHYYNTTDRKKDSNFSQVVDFFKVQTVPHAFIVHQGKIVNKINNQNSMEEIEKFLLAFQKLKS